MYSLTFLSAQQLVQDEDAICEDLACIPWVVYDILFRVAFKGNKKKLLCELVKTWPYSQLKFQKLMQACGCCSQTPSRDCEECQWPFKHKLNKNKIGAILLGVLSYIRKVVHDDSQQLPYRLQQVDLTGLLTQYVMEDVKFNRLWTKALSQAQVYSSSQQQQQCDPQSQARDQVAEASPVTTLPREVRVDLLVDLQVRNSSRHLLKEALQNNTNSPLQLTCRDFYADFVTVPEAVNFLALLDPLAFRRVDLSKSRMTLMDIRSFMSHITTFQNLQSLKLPPFNEAMEQGKDPMPSVNIGSLAAELGKFRHLREIALSHIYLSDQLQYLLRGLQCSLKSLQLSYCSLTSQDITCLARSHHSTHLIKLHLEGNNISTKLDSFLELLKSVSNSLKLLNIENCGLNDINFDMILTHLHSCSRLSYLGLYGNPLSSRSMFIFLGPCKQKMPKLQEISVPFFLDCCENLPQHGPLPESLHPYTDDYRLFSVMNQMKDIQNATGQSATLFFGSLIFDVADYFSLQ